ncbi:hypothetical protein BJ085DRAFT_29939 [Dimargaris cristalligena]|uniref:Armadillo-type protein n=1 Tax=Dimargaris cristalligena TaxID=215637 RepID=A0A4P9ZXC2_9FUNG|nr:hypothetical protein BJ085DRAFT_29939 [Dimargaris cristalligena]|eukprot:RKP37671.1 hypothetical protein BJ085DRAFT_29939 [Dimargaris cristalligena]
MAPFALDDHRLQAIRSPAEREQFLFLWLSDMEARLGSLDQNELKAIQPQLEVDLIRSISYPALKPSKPLREIVARCFVHLYLHGETRTLLDTLQRLRSLILAKQGSGEVRETKMAALYVIGQLFAALGDRILSQFTDVVLLCVKVAKTNGDALPLRLIAVDAMAASLQGAGRIASDATIKDLAKCLRSIMTEKPTSIVLVASRALLALVQHTNYINQLSPYDLDQLLATVLKWLDTPVLVLRTAIASLLAGILAAIYKFKVVNEPSNLLPEPSIPPVSSPGALSPQFMARSSSSQANVAEPGLSSVPIPRTHSTSSTTANAIRQRMSRSNTLPFVTLSDVLRHLSSPFGRTQCTRDLRAGIAETYRVLWALWGPEFVEAQYPVLLRHLFVDFLGSLQGSVSSRVERLSYRAFVSDLLRRGITLSERGKVTAVQELLTHWIKLPSQLPFYSGGAPSSSSRLSTSSSSGDLSVAKEVVLTCAIHELSHLLADLGNDAHLVQDGMVGPLLTLLSYPKYTIQIAAAECLKQFALAVPARLPRLLTRLLNLLQKDIANISNSGISLGVLKRCYGYALGLAAVVTVVVQCPLFVSYELTMWVASVANQLLKAALTPANMPRPGPGPGHPPGSRPSSRSVDLRVTNAQLRMGWILVAALLTLGPEFVRLHFSTWLHFWKLALGPGSPADGTTDPPADTDLLHGYQIREVALGALYHLLVYNRRLVVSGDSAKRVTGLLQTALQYLQTHPITRITSTAVLLSSSSSPGVSQNSYGSNQGPSPTGSATSLPSTLGLMEANFLVRRRLMACFTLLLPIQPYEALYPPLFRCVADLITNPEPTFSGMGDFIYSKSGNNVLPGSGPQNSGAGPYSSSNPSFAGSYIAYQSSPAFGASASRWGHETNIGMTSLLLRLLREPQHRRRGFAITENLFDSAGFTDFSHCYFGAFEHDVNNLLYVPTDAGYSSTGDTLTPTPPSEGADPLADHPTPGSLANSQVCSGPNPAGYPTGSVMAPYTSAVDAAIELFGILFSHTNEAVQISLLQDFLNVQQYSGFDRYSDRRYAIQVNCVLALFYSLRALAAAATTGGGRRPSDVLDDPTSPTASQSDLSPLGPRPTGTISTRVVQLMFEVLRGPIMHLDVKLRIAACETLGHLANQAGAKFISHTVNQLTMQAIHNRDHFARAGVALGLGSIYSHAGSMTASVHLKSVVVLLHSLSRDSNPVVHNWGLHALAITIDAAGMMFVPYVSITVMMLAKLFMSETHEYTLEAPAEALAHDLHVEHASRGLGQVLCALLGAYGPELPFDEQIKGLCMVMMRELRYNRQELTTIEYIRCCQQVLMFAPQEMAIPPLLQFLREAIRAPEPAVRAVGAACLLQLVKRNAPDVLRLIGRDHMMIQLFVLADRHPSLGDTVRILRSLLEQIESDQLVPLTQMLRGIFTRFRERGDSLAQEPAAVGESAALDEEGASFVPMEGINSSASTVSKAGLPATFSTPTRALSLRCLRFLLLSQLQLVQPPTQSPSSMPLPTSFEDDYGPKGPTIPARLLPFATHVADLIRIAFIAATCHHETLQAEGLGLLQMVIQLFAGYDDPDFPGASMLEQYQAQITAAFAPALAGTLQMPASATASIRVSDPRAGLASGSGSVGGLGTDYSPSIQVLAIKLGAVFAGSGITRDPLTLQRILKPLILPLHNDGISVVNSSACLSPLEGSASPLSRSRRRSSVVATPLSRERAISFRSSATEGTITDFLNPHVTVILRLALLRAWADMYIASQGPASYLLPLLEPHLAHLCRSWIDTLKDSILIQLNSVFFTLTGAVSQAFNGPGNTSLVDLASRSEPPSPIDEVAASHNFASSSVARSKSQVLLHCSTGDPEEGDSPEMGLSLGLEPTYAAATRNILAHFFQLEWVRVLDAVGQLLAHRQPVMLATLTEFNSRHDHRLGGATSVTETTWSPTSPPFPRAEYIVYGLCVQYLYTAPKTLEHADAMSTCLRTLGATLQVPCSTSVEIAAANPLLRTQSSDEAPFALTALEDQPIFTELWCVLDRMVQLESTVIRQAIVDLVHQVVSLTHNTLLADAVLSVPPVHMISDDVIDLRPHIVTRIDHVTQLPPDCRLWQVLALLLNVHKHTRASVARIPLTMDKCEAPELQLVCSTLERFSQLIMTCTLLPPVLAAEIAAMGLHLLTTLVAESPLQGRNTGLVLRVLRSWLVIDYTPMVTATSGEPAEQTLTAAVVEALDAVMGRCCQMKNEWTYPDLLKCSQGFSFAALLCSSLRGIRIPNDHLLGYFQDVAAALQAGYSGRQLYLGTRANPSSDGAEKYLGSI